MTRVEALDPAAYEAAIDGLAELLVDAVDHGAGVNFMAGVTTAETRAWWEGRRGGVADGTVVPVVAFDDDGRVVGSTVLLYAWNPNSPPSRRDQQGHRPLVGATAGVGSTADGCR